MRSESKKLNEKTKNPLDLFYLDIRKNGKILNAVIGGVIGVVEFSDENAILSTYTGKINISGEMLKVAIFENKTIQITGKIKEIELY